MNSSPAAGLPGELLPLLPVRHATEPWETSELPTVPPPVAIINSGAAGLDDPSPDAGDRHYLQLLNGVSRSLLSGKVTDAVRGLQQAQQWKNRWEEATSRPLCLTPEHWVLLSACSTAAGDDDSAAAFAIQAWNAARQNWKSDLDHDFRDSSADATTLLALNRLRQRRPQRAAALLGCAIDDHQLAGDMEQLTADYLLLFRCEEEAGQADRAAAALQTARRLLTESLDAARHPRRPQLHRWLRRYGRPRPMLLKSR